MKFKQSCQNEMDRLSPTDEQRERIRNGVYERLKHEDNNTEPAPNRRKKSLRLKIAALSGGACACAAALTIFVIGGVHVSNEAPMLNSPDNFGLIGGTHNSTNHNINGAQGTDGDRMDTTGKSSPPSAIVSGSLSEGSNDGETYIEMSTVTAPGSSAPLYLMFSEDKSGCTVTMNGKKYVYCEPEFDPDLSAENYDPFINMNDNPLRIADSNLDIELFVQFDENFLYVFTESKTLYKSYILK